MATLLLHQFRGSLDFLKMTRDLCLRDDEYSDLIFFKDYSTSYSSELAILRGGDVFSSSLFLSLLHRLLFLNYERVTKDMYQGQFPRGLPQNLTSLHFVLEAAIDWIPNQLASLPRPFLAYFHLLPPHEPYRPRKEFIDRFDDGWMPVSKTTSHFSEGFSPEDLNDLQRFYDEFVAYADAEFGRLLESLRRERLLDNTYLILTSDHGQLFERGIHGHITEALYEPLIRVPLLVSSPGQGARKDVSTPVSGVDVLPTLLQQIGQPIPQWLEGQPLPGLNSEQVDAERSIYVVEAKSNPKGAPLAKASLAMIKGSHKLIRYFGYEAAQDVFEMYDLANDPEELANLYSPQNALGTQLRKEMESKLNEINRADR